MGRQQARQANGGIGGRGHVELAGAESLRRREPIRAERSGGYGGVGGERRIRMHGWVNGRLFEEVHRGEGEKINRKEIVKGKNGRAL